MTQLTIDKDQLVLGYWAARGRVESSRLLLQYTKTPFVDKMYQMGDAPDYNRDGWLNEKYTLGLREFNSVFMSYHKMTLYLRRFSQFTLFD